MWTAALISVERNSSGGIALVIKTSPAPNSNRDESGFPEVLQVEHVCQTELNALKNDPNGIEMRMQRTMTLASGCSRASDPGATERAS